MGVGALVVAQPSGLPMRQFGVPRALLMEILFLAIFHQQEPDSALEGEVVLTPNSRLLP
jgi:hypothetical protein